MKTIYLMRHSKPMPSNAKNEDIPLSEEGKALLLEMLDRMGMEGNFKIYSSPCRRAYETAKLMGNSVAVDQRLAERRLGVRETFTKEIWRKQYLDCDLRNPMGESFRSVRERMTQAMDEILSQMSEGQTAVVVSHAAAICAYLQQFCEITVTDADKKQRRITHNGTVIMDGTLYAPSCFQLTFSGKLTRISYIH